MPRLKYIPRLFISHAREDRLRVRQLADDLAEAGIGVWTDFEDLAIGTPDWEAEVRAALGQSFAVLLVASPATRAAGALVLHPNRGAHRRAKATLASLMCRVRRAAVARARQR